MMILPPLPLQIRMIRSDHSNLQRFRAEENFEIATGVETDIN